MFRAQSVHRAHFDPTEVQISTLLSIKTGGCPEDCAYCPQSAHYDTGVRAEKLMALDAVLAEARAREGAAAPAASAWARPGARRKTAISTQVCAMVEGVKALGLETCATLGMLTAAQARRLKDAGLDYYNHNLDTSPEFYGNDHHHAHLSGPARHARPRARRRASTSAAAASSAWARAREDRVGMIATLASLPAHPESVPINMLVRVAGTPLAGEPRARPDRVRAHHRGRPHHHAALGGAAVGRPRGHERGDAGAVLPRRRQLDLLRAEAADHAQPGRDRDQALLDRLGMTAMVER